MARPFIRLRVHTWFGVALALVAGAGLARAQRGAVPEYNAKAGFLTTFPKYTSWPAGTFASDDAPVVICVLGRDPFGDVLDRTAAESHGGRPILVRRLHGRADAEICHVVFIGKSETANEAGWLMSLRRKPMLTVGESGQAFGNGAIVEFAIAGGRLGFDVNLPAAELAGIRFSSDLLSHARRVQR